MLDFKFSKIISFSQLLAKRFLTAARHQARRACDPMPADNDAATASNGRRNVVWSNETR